jgi:hypothetical protein
VFGLDFYTNLSSVVIDQETPFFIPCFLLQVTNTYKRYKHWFQEEDLLKVPDKSAVVVAMFRDPYNWVEAMRVEPHHAHDHLQWYRPPREGERWKTIARPLEWKEFVTKPWIGGRGSTDKNIRYYLPGVNGKKYINGGTNDDGEWNARPLEWKEFVTKPWIGQRRPKDIVISRTNRGMNSAKCMDSYSFYDAVPCSVDDSSTVDGLGLYMYEYQHDGSERGFSSIIDLRREKILNHLSVANFRGTRAFFPFRFEDLNENGTGALIRSVEDATGIKAKCNATNGKAPRRRRLVEKRITKHRELSPDLIRWMSRYVNWEVEGRIGYSKRCGIVGGILC